MEQHEKFTLDSLSPSTEFPCGNTDKLVLQIIFLVL